jgi:hypothetical protein
MVSAPRRAFDKCTVQQLLKLVRVEEIEEVWTATSFPDLLEKCIVHYCPSFGALVLYDAMMLREPPTPEMLEQLYGIEEFKEFVDSKDWEGVDKDQKKLEKQNEGVNTYWKLLDKKSALLKDCFQALERSKAPDARSRGPAGYVDELITQELAESWVPPGSRIELDRFNQRWRIHWRFGEMSRSFQLHGFKRALIFVLRAAWTSMEQYSGLACPVPGIMAAPATIAASGVEAAMPHSTAGHGADAAERKDKLKMNVATLKGLLKEKGLIRTGKKLEHVDRLCGVYCTTAAPVAATAAEALSKCRWERRTCSLAKVRQAAAAPQLQPPTKTKLMRRTRTALKKQTEAAARAVQAFRVLLIYSSGS